ncbi:MAG TPA: lasso peptide biosynthesis B2 protein [Steroidobacteraceae bacterium]
MDLERDKYLAVAHPHPVGRWVRGWPVPQAASFGSAREGDARPVPGPENGLLAKMISQGLLVIDPAQGKEAAPVSADEPKVSLVEYDVRARPHARPGHLWNFFAAYAVARWSLEHRPIKEVVQAARLRKKRTQTTSGHDIAAIRALVTAFVHLRPLFYTARDACLLDSLTLMHFLARYGVPATWVFGVKTDPFYAHCWVQHGDFVFNDSPDFIKGFSPILVV